LADSALVKASLEAPSEENIDTVHFQFNPTEYTLTANTSWKQTPAKGKKAPKSEYTGNLPMTLAFDVLFDDNWATAKPDVGLGAYDMVMQLQFMTLPTDASVGKSKPSAPELLFRWGSQLPFKCHLKTATVKYLMFKEDGTPTRAIASLVLEEIEDEPPRQNPTSGGPGGNRAHVVGEGDSLASIAFREYDDAALWRGLADLNGIEDPMGLRIGQRLIVPPYEHVAARS
jgi:nucleoid-associated protein YgaU